MVIINARAIEGGIDVMTLKELKVLTGLKGVELARLLERTPESISRWGDKVPRVVELWALERVEAEKWRAFVRLVR